MALDDRIIKLMNQQRTRRNRIVQSHVLESDSDRPLLEFYDDVRHYLDFIEAGIAIDKRDVPILAEVAMGIWQDCPELKPLLVANLRAVADAIEAL